MTPVSLSPGIPLDSRGPLHSTAELRKPERIGLHSPSSVELEPEQHISIVHQYPRTLRNIFLHMKTAYISYINTKKNMNKMNSFMKT